MTSLPNPSATRASIGVRPPALRAGICSALAGLAILAVCAAWALSWRDQLPAAVATHWGSDGADSYSSPTASVLTGTAVGAGCTLLLGAATAWSGRSALYRRILVGLTVGMAALIGTVLLVTLHAQIGLADAHATGAVDGVGGRAALVGIIAAVVVGGLASLLVRPDEARAATAPGGVTLRVPLAPGERAAWSRRVTGRAAVLIAVGTAVVVVAIAMLADEPGLLVVAAALALLLAAFASWDVTVDARGLRVRSLLGVPRRHLAAADVARAEAVDVHPLRDFGGWGWRAGRDGSTGIIVRGGEGLRIERTDGRALVVTIDDAAAGAALLNTMAERARSTR